MLGFSGSPSARRHFVLFQARSRKKRTLVSGLTVDTALSSLAVNISKCYAIYYVTATQYPECQLLAARFFRKTTTGAAGSTGFFGP